MENERRNGRMRMNMGKMKNKEEVDGRAEKKGMRREKKSQKEGIWKMEEKDVMIEEDERTWRQGMKEGVREVREQGKMRGRGGMWTRMGCSLQKIEKGGRRKRMRKKI